MQFNVVSGENNNAASNTSDPAAQIQSMIQKSPVFLFMKGNPEAPQCGFSYRVCEILRKWDVPFESFNVLSDEGIRQGIKSFSDWPTIPQLYVKEEFVGGCDIVEELSATGELESVLKNAYPDRSFTPPPPPAEAQPMEPKDAEAFIAENANARVLDVRTPDEWDVAHLEGSELVTQELVEALLKNEDKNTPLLCICHHGMRSADAARFFAAEGFQKVYNITGGIDRWAQEVDPSLARY